MDKEQTTVRLPVELKEQLHEQADKMGISFNGWVNYLLGLGVKTVIQNQL